jgi:hypothetical protein
MQRLDPKVTLAGTLLLSLGACHDIVGFGEESTPRESGPRTVNGAGRDSTSDSGGMSTVSGGAPGRTGSGVERGGQTAPSAAGEGPGDGRQTGPRGGGVGSAGASSAAIQPTSAGVEGSGLASPTAIMAGTSSVAGSAGSPIASLDGGAGTSFADGQGDPMGGESATTTDRAGAAGAPNQVGERGPMGDGGRGGTSAVEIGGSSPAAMSGAAGSAAMPNGGSSAAGMSGAAGSAAMPDGGSSAAGMSGAAGSASMPDGGSAGNAGMAGTAGAAGASADPMVSCAVDLTTLEHDCGGSGPIRVMTLAEGMTLFAGETLPDGETLANDWTLPDGMGKVRVDFTGHQELEVEVEVNDPNGYVLDIGDSKTNDGGGGDWQTTAFDAELDVVERVARRFPLFLYASDLNPGEADAIHIAEVPAFFVPEGKTVRRLFIRDRIVRLDDDQQWEDGALFRVSSLPPAPPDAIVYIGLNRVIDDMAQWYLVSRVGSGVKKATFRLR